LNPLGVGKRFYPRDTEGEQTMEKTARLPESFVALTELGKILRTHDENYSCQVAVDEKGSSYLNIFKNGEVFISVEIHRDQFGLVHIPDEKLHAFVDASLIDSLG